MVVVSFGLLYLGTPASKHNREKIENSRKEDEGQKNRHISIVVLSLSLSKKDVSFPCFSAVCFFWHTDFEHLSLSLSFCSSPHQTCLLMMTKQGSNHWTQFLLIHSQVLLKLLAQNLSSTSKKEKGDREKRKKERKRGVWIMVMRDGYFFSWVLLTPSLYYFPFQLEATETEPDKDKGGPWCLSDHWNGDG